MALAKSLDFGSQVVLGVDHDVHLFWAMIRFRKAQFNRVGKMAKKLIIKSPYLAIWGGREFRCAVGRGGIVPAQEKEAEMRYCTVGILLLVLARCAGDEALAITATASAVVVPPSAVGHNPDDLAQIARLKHTVNSMLQKGC